MDPKLRAVVIGTMLLFDAIVGIVVAVLVSPVVGAIAFVVSASISLFTSRAVLARRSQSSENPYARED